jgi:major membrane immunogen (membrane-anchored lipoprotein)
MESAVGTKPETYLPEYEAALVESQDVTEVDSISGATQSYSEFVKLAQEALGKAVEK